MRTFLCTLLLVAACLASGCSGAKQVKGKITKGGQPFSVSDKGVFVLNFVAEGGDKKSYSADTKKDGTFTILGPESKGIPAGKYKVELQAFDPYAGPASTDTLKGKFAPGKSAYVVDVGSGELVLDVDK